MIRLRLSTVFATVVLFAAPLAGALPVHKAALERHFDRFLAKRLASCSVCHLPSDKKDPESLEEFPHNPFGAAVDKAGRQLRKEGKKREMAARLDLIAADDSDGDGVDNAAELLLGYNPGDAKDKPSAEVLSTLPAKREAFAAYLKGYRWQPFEPVVRPAVPSVAGVTHPIDAFVAEQRQARGLDGSPPAPKHVLLRRVYLDLIGLNPTPDEIAAFDADVSPDAYEKVVERLLASPLYGQRWARHWMDVWRYSDWAGWSGGNQIRDSQPHIWRWRDWIVESLNADKGYDRMLTEMLAGDEVAPTDASTLRATGYLVRNYKMLSREQWLEDVVNHTSRAFLGVTLHCAKCHDHMFDPATQDEYFRFRAIFEPHNVRTDPVPGQPDTKLDGLVRAFDAEPNAPTYFFTRGDERTPDKGRGVIKPGLPDFLGGGELKADPIALPPDAYQPHRRAFAVKDAIVASEKTVAATKSASAKVNADAKATAAQKSEADAAVTVATAAHAALLAVLKAEELEAKKDSPDWKAAAAAAKRAQREHAVAIAQQALVVAKNKLPAETPPGDKAQGAKAQAAKDVAALKAKIVEAEKALAKTKDDLASTIKSAATDYTPRVTKTYPPTSTGRRLAFARWLTNPKNPLTARVAVNHLWARHFAQGLVPSTDDFGRNGRPPTHPAMLDYLAAELVAHNWQMKPIHRLIVTSATYRQTSIAASSSLSVQHSGLSADPDDAYLWRFPTKRMEAELVRDNVLWSSNQLDLSPGGPEIDHALGLTSKRRSLFFRIAPEKEVEFLKVFDGPNPNECYCRRPSVIPQQALALGNSQLVVEQQKLVAKSLSETSPDDEAFIRAAFLRVLARPATPEEVTACREFLGREKTPARARENLVGVLFNHNDFIAIR